MFTLFIKKKQLFYRFKLITMRNAELEVKIKKDNVVKFYSLNLLLNFIGEKVTDGFNAPLSFR